MTTGDFDAQRAHAQGPEHMDGEVATGIPGADAAWPRRHAGAGATCLSRSPYASPGPGMR